MAYHFENIKLEKGMYGRSSRSFSQTLEQLDPSEHYRGTPLERAAITSISGFAKLFTEASKVLVV